MRVLIVDRKPLFRDCLAALVRSQITGLDVHPVPSISEAAPLMGRVPLGLLILEAEQATGDQLLAAIRLIHPGWRIVLLGGSPACAAAPYIEGHFDTDSDSETMIAVVRRLVGTTSARPARSLGNGGGPQLEALDPAGSEVTGQGSGPPSPLPGGSRPARPLTRRQQDVLSLLAQGRSTKDIARALDLGIGTIKAHLDGLYRTLGVHSRIAAVARAQEFLHLAPGLAVPGLAVPLPGGSNVIRLDARASHHTAATDPADAPPARTATAAR